MTRVMQGQGRGAVAPEVLIGEYVHNWPGSLRQAAKPATAVEFDGRPRKLQMASPPVVEREPAHASPAEADEPAMLSDPTPPMEDAPPRRAQRLTPPSPLPVDQAQAFHEVQEAPGAAAQARARTVRATHLPAPIRAARQVQQAHPLPPPPPRTDVPVTGFDPQPAAGLPAGMDAPVGRRSVALQEGAQAEVQAQLHAGQVLDMAARHAERARTEARVDVRRCGFLRKAMTRMPAVLLATFDLACALVVTLATFLYANKVLAVACRNFKLAVLGPVPPPAAAGAPSEALQAQAFRSDDSEPSDRVIRLAQSLQSARDSMKRAGDEAKVQSAAKASFVRRALIVGTGAIGLGAAIAATVLSGGATLAIPGLVLGTVLMRNFIANARCAWQNRQRALANQPLLPMGNNALNNALYRYYVDQQKYTDGKARLEASKVGSSVSVLIGLAQFGSMMSTLLVGSAAVHAIHWVKEGIKGSRLGATVTRASLNTYELSRVKATRDQQLARRLEATERAQQVWGEFLEEVNQEKLENLPLARVPDQDTVDQHLDQLSGLMADWSVNGARLDELPEFMSREGWLNGAAPPQQAGRVKPGDDAVSQAQRIRKDLHQRQQASTLVDAGLLTTISWSLANWAQTFKLFLESYL